MKPRHVLVRQCLLGLCCALLTACNLPGSPGASGPHAWIDYPADGMSFSFGTIVVQSHATGPSGVSQVDLYVNGTRRRTDLNPDSAAGLVPMSQAWVPEGPGAYTLEVRAQDADGNEGHSRLIHVVITGCPTPVGGGPTPVSCGPTATPVVVCPSPVGGGPTPVSCSETPTATLVPAGVSPAAASCQQPTGSFTVNANCREGPGTAYDAVDALPAGQSVPIVGRNDDGSWFMVQRPSGGSCWVSAVTLSVCGDVGSVGVVAAPQLPAAPPPPPEPPPAAAKPAAPGNLRVDQHVCEGSKYAVTLAWEDAADNESGYRVYRSKSLIATLGPDSSDYTDSPAPGGPYTYLVEAYNDAGTGRAETSDPGCIF